MKEQIINGETTKVLVLTARQVEKMEVDSEDDCKFLLFLIKYTLTGRSGFYIGPNKHPEFLGRDFQQIYKFKFDGIKTCFFMRIKLISACFYCMSLILNWQRN